MAKKDRKYVVTGFGSIDRKLRKFPFVLQKKMARDTIKKIIKDIVLPEAKRLAPYDSSNDRQNDAGKEMHLRDSLKRVALKRTRTRVGSSVATKPKEGENPRKGAYVEFGTRSGTPKFMYARKALYSQETKIRRALKKGLKKVIKEERIKAKLKFWTGF